MASAGAVTIDVDAKTAKLEAGMSRAQAITQREMEKMQLSTIAAGTAIGVALGNIASSVISHMANMVKTGIEAASTMSLVSEKTGVSVQVLAGLRRESIVTGESFEGMQKGLERMAVAASTNSTAFKAMGVNTKNGEGHLKTTEQLLSDVAKKFAGYNDGAAKTALAMKVFGREGAEMIPMLNRIGEEGLQGLTDKAAAAAKALGKDGGGKAAKEFRESLGELRADADDFSIQLGQALLPALQSTVNLFKDPQFKSAIDGITESIGVFAQKAVEAAGKLALLYNQGRAIAGASFGNGINNEDDRAEAQAKLDALRGSSKPTNDRKSAETAFNRWSPGVLIATMAAAMDPQFGGKPSAGIQTNIDGLQAQIAAYDKTRFAGVTGGVLTGGPPLPKTDAPVLAGVKTGTAHAKKISDAPQRAADAAELRLQSQIEQLQSHVEGPATAAWNTYAKAVRDAAAQGAIMIKGGKDVTQVQAQVSEAVTAASAAWKKYKDDADKAFERGNKEIEAQLQPTKVLQQTAQATLAFADAQDALNRSLADGSINQAQFNKRLTLQKELLDKQVEDIKNAADEVNQFALQAAKNIQDMIGTTFYDTFKGVQGGFKGILASWGDMLLKMIAQAQAAQLAKALFGDYGNTGKVGGMFGSLISGFLGGTDATGGAGASTYNSSGFVSHVDFGGGHANGGPVTSGSMYEVAEGGKPELLNAAGRTYLMMGSAGGTVTPASNNLPTGSAANSPSYGGGGDMQVEINITNNGQPVNAQQGTARMDGKKMMIDLILDTVSGDMAGGGKTAKAAQQRFGLQRRGVPVGGG